MASAPPSSTFGPYDRAFIKFPGLLVDNLINAIQMITSMFDKKDTKGRLLTVTKIEWFSCRWGECQAVVDTSYRNGGLSQGFFKTWIFDPLNFNSYLNVF